MGFPQEDVMQIIRIVSAILLLGNISFISTEDGEASEIASLEQLNHVATALHVDPLILKYALCNRSIESGKRSKSMITIKLNVAKAADGRDSLARAIYDKLFIDIIASINKNSHSDDNFDGNMSDRSIGLLDIFGFEIFVENSFEQICINYCNER
jgi:myosin heavy subunit